MARAGDRGVSIASGVVLVGLLAGCALAGTTGEPDRGATSGGPRGQGAFLDLREAKASSLTLLTTAMAAVPAEEWPDRDYRDPGVLLSCADDAWSWNTNGEIDFDAGEDLEAWVSAIGRGIERTLDAEVEESTDRFGDAALDARLPDGTAAHVSISLRDPRLFFSVHSPCVTDLADYYETPKPAGGY